MNRVQTIVIKPIKLREIKKEKLKNWFKTDQLTWNIYGSSSLNDVNIYKKFY